jgi:prophage DNA circulation protein
VTFKPKTVAKRTTFCSTKCRMSAFRSRRADVPASAPDPIVVAAPEREQQEHENTVGSAVAVAMGELSELAAEMREAFENTPENLQASEVGQMREAAADALEALDGECSEVPACLLDLSVQETPATRRRPSRASRRDEAVALLAAAVAAVENWLADQSGKRAVAAEVVSEARPFRDHAQDVIDQAEAVEFPGMYG